LTKLTDKTKREFKKEYNMTQPHLNQKNIDELNFHSKLIN